MLKIRLIFIVLVVTTLFLASAPPTRQISDEQKKEIVYQMYSKYKKEFQAIMDIHPRKAMELLDKDDFPSIASYSIDIQCIPLIM